MSTSTVVGCLARPRVAKLANNDEAKRGIVALLYKNKRLRTYGASAHPRFVFGDGAKRSLSIISDIRRPAKSPRGELLVCMSSLKWRGRRTHVQLFTLFMSKCKMISLFYNYLPDKEDFVSVYNHQPIYLLRSANREIKRPSRRRSKESWERTNFISTTKPHKLSSVRTALGLTPNISWSSLFPLKTRFKV